MSDKKSTGAIKKKRDQKKQRRDANGWENLVKSLEGVDETEKWKAIEAKYKELHVHFIESQDTIKEFQKVIGDLESQNNHLNREMAKMMVNKTKIEAVARELQKQNREIKDYNQIKFKEEEERRKLVASSFTEKLNTLNGLMDENRENSNKLKDENMNMRSKLQELYVQFQEREQHVMDMNRQIELQTKLTETQFRKLELEFATEKDLWEKERALLVSKCERTEQTNKVLESNVKSLQGHLDAYQKQFSDFETTIIQSNKIYDNFKDDMVKLQTENKELIKERNIFRVNTQQLATSALKLSEKNQNLSEVNKNLERKCTTLDNLCRRLQQERTHFYQKQKDSDEPDLENCQVIEELIKQTCFNEVATQTDFNVVVRRLPVAWPGTQRDRKIYIEAEEGKLVRLNLDMSSFHDKYITLINDMSRSDGRKHKTAKSREVLIQRFKNFTTADTDVVLDIGLLADGKVSVVANLGNLYIGHPFQLFTAYIIDQNDENSDPKTRTQPVKFIRKNVGK